MTLPIGKMLMLPARIAGVFQDEYGQYKYMIELPSQKVGDKAIVVDATATENVKDRFRHAAEAGEVHPNGWPT